MKKITYLILLLLFSFSLISCNSKEDTEEKEVQTFRPKNLVINTVKTVTTDEFLNSLAIGLQNRWDVELYSEMNKYDTNRMAVEKEHAAIEKYTEYEFEDKDLEDLYIHYFSSINMQMNAFDDTFKDKYIDLWNIGYKPYLEYLKEFETHFDLSNYIDEAYKNNIELFLK